MQVTKTEGRKTDRQVGRQENINMQVGKKGDREIGTQVRYEIR